MTAASWTILVLCALLALTVLVSALWLRSRGAEITRLIRERDAADRAVAKHLEEDQLHAQPDLGSLLHRPRTSDR